MTVLEKSTNIVHLSEGVIRFDDTGTGWATYCGLAILDNNDVVKASEAAPVTCFVCLGTVDR